MSNLHPGQFQLFEPEERIPRAKNEPRDLGVPDDFEPYDTPHQYQTGWEPNPNFSQPAWDEFRHLSRSHSRIHTREDLSWNPPHRSDEWVHPPDLESPQKDIHPGGVEQLAKVTPEESQGLPNVNVWKKNGRQILMDGNHRLAAAQRRGNLWIGADVWEH